MRNVLHIDTSDNKKIKIGIEKEGNKKTKLLNSKNLKSQTCLLLINKLLCEEELKPQDLNAIVVNRGPGSFTGLRVGIAIANTISYLITIPINRKKIGDLEEPVYN